MNMQKPSDAQIVQAFDALSSENARPLQTLLYLNATQYHHVQDPKTGKSMVHVAIENDRLALASLLIQKKFPVNVIDGQGQTPLQGFPLSELRCRSLRMGSFWEPQPLTSR